MKISPTIYFMQWCRWHSSVLTTLVAIAVLEPLAWTDPPKGSASPTCAEILNNLATERTRAGAIPSGLATRVLSVRAQLTQLEEPGVVVYSIVPNKDGMAMLRFESAGTGKPLIEATIAKSDLDAAKFRKAISAARQQGNRHYQDVLRDEFSKPRSKIDDGKLVFFLDPDGYGLAPQAFDFPNALVLGSENISDAIRNVRSLQNRPKTDAKFAALIGIPSTPEEYAKTFGVPSGEGNYPPLEEWSPHWKTAQEIAARNQITVLSPPTIKDALRLLGQQDGIVVIVAHADGLHIKLPGNQTISLGPSEISKAHLKGSPFVFLRVCQGSDVGFADAFLKAGAGGVWTNRGVIDVAVANRQMDIFMQKLRANLTIQEAIAAVMSGDPHAKNSTVLLTDLLVPKLSR